MTKCIPARPIKLLAIKSNRHHLPGFGLSLGISVFYVALLILLPLSTVFLGLFSLSWLEFWNAISSDRVIAAYKLTFGASLAAAVCNLFIGLLLAWVLVRYRFPGQRIIDGLIDLPFALPTAVAGITLTTLYSNQGWLGRWLSQIGINVAFTPLGVFVALVFVGLPFVVRSVQPLLQDFIKEHEEAAATMGASNWQIFYSVILPYLWPGLLAGFTMAFARALGEYGSVVFISGNLPHRTEIVPLLIMSRLEQYDYSGAKALALVMLLCSFALMLILNLAQQYMARKGESTG